MSITRLTSDLVKYASGTVQGALMRMVTLFDKGLSRRKLGYSSADDADAFVKMSSGPDQELLLAGGLHISKKYRGIRRNNNALGLRGGILSTGAGAFNDQVTGVSTAQQLAIYGTHDGVTGFLDGTLPPLEAWEDVSSVVSYTATSVTLDTATYSDTMKKIRVGDVITTKHSPKVWALVDSYNESTGVITVSEWATSSTNGVTPSGTTGFRLNAIDKVWALNANIIVESNSYGQHAVISELGMQIKKAGMSTANGTDTVLLNGSTADGTAANLVRTALSNFTWTYGYNAQGCRFNFHSASGGVQPYAGFNERSNAVVGMRFHTGNTYSMLWGTGANTSTALADSVTIFGPNGHVFRQPKRLQVVSADHTMSALFPYLILTTAGIQITLPPIANMPVAGYEFEFLLAAVGSYSFTASGQETQVSGLNNYTVTTTKARRSLRIIWDGTYWQVVDD